MRYQSRSGTVGINANDRCIGPPLGVSVMFRRSPAHHLEPGTVVGRCFGVPQVEVRDSVGGIHRLSVSALTARGENGGRAC